MRDKSGAVVTAEEQADVIALIGTLRGIPNDRRLIAIARLIDAYIQIPSLTLEPSPSPTATSFASPPAPASPDSAGASCGPLAGSTPACKGCGLPRLRQSDTSDHPGVVRCDACGLVQAS